MERQEQDFFSAFKSNFSKCHTFTLTHTVMDYYLSSFHSARENVKDVKDVEEHLMFVFNPVYTLIFSQYQSKCSWKISEEIFSLCSHCECTRLTE